jgi:predicted Zn-dependent protease with MMP-like domain
MPKRRRGSNRARPIPAPSPLRAGVGGGRFEAIVARALDGIPPPFSAALAEVAVVIEDEPSPVQRRDNGLDLDDMLYGLYEGVPRTEWAADWAISANKISIFRLPLEDDFPDPADLEEEVRLTVIHELAHHLGIDDERLGDLGVD